MGYSRHAYQSSLSLFSGAPGLRRRHSRHSRQRHFRHHHDNDHTHIFPRAVYDQALNKDPPLSRLAVAMAPKLSKSPNANSWSPEDTKEGTLPPFEVAKAFAFDVVLRQMESHLGKSCWQLLGEGKTAFTAKH